MTRRKLANDSVMLENDSVSIVMIDLILTREVSVISEIGVCGFTKPCSN